MNERGAELVIFIPLKPLTRAKGRLRRVLPSHEREQLVRQMFRRVLHAVQQAAVPARVFVLAGDGEVARLAEQVGVPPLVESGGWRLDHVTPDGLLPMPPTPALTEDRLNRILNDALTWAEANGWSRALILPADLPFLTPGDVEALWRLSQETPVPHLILAPDQAGKGTNALLLAPPTALVPAFGRDSFTRHLLLARAQGLHVRVLRSSGLAHDVDTADDPSLAREPQHIPTGERRPS